jgi:hypothetical protein
MDNFRNSPASYISACSILLRNCCAYLVDESRPGGLEPVEERHEVTVAGVRVPVQVDLAGGAAVPEHLLCKPHNRV